MKKILNILNILKYKLSWQTYKDAFFWTFVSIWLFVDVVVAACIWNIDPDTRLFIIHGINYVFILFFAVLNLIKCRGGKFNDWLNTKFEK